MNRVEWMKGICHLWSRGRHFSPSLPGNRYLKLSSQKRSPGRNLGEHRLVRRSGTASRGTAILVVCLRMRSVPGTEVFTVILGKNIRVGSIKDKAQICINSTLHRFLLKKIAIARNGLDYLFDPTCPNRIIVSGRLLIIFE